MDAAGKKRVEAVMTTPVETIRASATVRDAATRMREHDVNSLLVPGSEMGIVTSTDVLDAIAAGRDPSRAEVAGLMTSPVESVRADLQLREAAEMMTTYGIDHLPVRDVQGDYIGVVSSTDVRKVMGDTSG